MRTREYDELLKLLREAREAGGISQEVLSKKIGRSRTFVSKIEEGTRRVDVVELFQLCTALQIDPIAFLTTYQKTVQ